MRISLGAIAVFATLSFFSCKKINPEKEPAATGSQEDIFPGSLAGKNSPINPTCGRSLYQKVASYHNDIDTLDLVKDSSVVYFVHTPSTEERTDPVIVYKIPFNDNAETAPHFLLVATDLTETKFKGNEVRINPSEDYRISGAFNGTISCKPIDSTITEIFSFVDSRRVTYLPNGKQSIVPASMPYYVPLPEVVVTGYINPGGGISYVLWMNLLDMLGITAGQNGWGGGGGSGSGGGGGSSGGPYSTGYYGPVIGNGGGSNYPGGGGGDGEAPPPPPDCTMPVVLPHYIDNKDPTIDSLLAEYASFCNKYRDSLSAVCETQPRKERFFNIVNLNNQLEMFNFLVGETDNEVIPKYTMQGGRILKAEWHYHTKYSDETSGSYPSGGDISTLRDKPQNHVMIIDTYDARYALVVENPTKMVAWMRIPGNGPKVLPQRVADLVYTDPRATLTGAAYVQMTKEIVLGVLGSSATCGIGLYEATASGTTFTKVN